MDHISGLFCPLASSRFSQREFLAGDREEYEVGVCIFQESLCRNPVGWLSFCSVPSSFWPRVVSALVLSLGLALPVYKIVLLSKLLELPSCRHAIVSSQDPDRYRWQQKAFLRK